MTNINAYETFTDALKQTVFRFRRMGTANMLEEAVKIAHESGHTFAPTAQFGDVLKVLARDGSIDAMAVMVCIGCSYDDIKEALDALTQRMPSVREGAAEKVMVEELTEFAEAEVKAGRMEKIYDPATGRAKYRQVKKKRRRR